MLNSHLLTYIILFILGLVVGSFLNALIYRLRSSEKIGWDRSKCPRCGTELTALDLIPVISFFILQRRCRHCSKEISWQYPLVEIVTAVTFLFIYYQLSIINYQLVFQFIFVSLLIVIFVYDLKHYLILDKVVWPAVVLAVIYQIVRGNFLSGLYGALALAGFFAVLYFVSKGRWIGFGDVKLGVFLGLLAGFPEVVVTFFLAYVSGAVVAVPLLVFGKRKMADRLPFGTFLTFAGFITMIWGQELMNWYLGLIGF